MSGCGACFVWLLPRERHCRRGYHSHYRWWFAFGFPLFAAVLTIILLMLTKPSF
ncbi:DUF2269 family protein [Brucella anthropi]|uniref:DUF2269 family protein n=1 Tax=Brucella TaxID=234 RepID=UPI001CFEA1D6|nr:DUF2269 family protein [Brucella anthropi]UZD71781.1 DUF2269 domain-containing protein [Brucella sp. JSBI001]